MLQTRAFENGVESPWAWFNSLNEFFFDENGRLIAFMNAEYGGGMHYDHLVLTNECAELHRIVSLDHDEFESWWEHHWEVWDVADDGTRHSSVRVDGWLYNSPIMFRTGIPLTLIRPDADLQDEITAAILGR